MALKPNRTWAALIAAAVLLGLLTTFAIELANTQGKDQADVRARVHQRAVLASALIDGLFSTVTQQTAVDRHLYGGRVVSRAVLNHQRQTNAYIAVLNNSGSVLAASQGFTTGLAKLLPTDVAVTMVQAGSLYGLGNVLPYGRGSVLNFAVPFKSQAGQPRILVTGFLPGLLGTFLKEDVKKIPGVSGETNYVLDGNGVVLASTSAKLASGAHFPGPHPAGRVTNFSRDTGGHYYDEVRLQGSDWRIALDSPDGPLYASVSGLNQSLPWVIFAAFALVACAAFWLVGRVIAAAGQTRRANERLATLNQELGTTNQLLGQRAAELARSNEELDQFASIASHDLQEPLRKVRTFTQELTRFEADRLSDKGRDYVLRANAAAERMQTLIEDLLKFSRVSTHAQAFRAVDLAQVVDEVLGDLSDSIERGGATVHVGELPTISGEPLQIRQLVQNLVSNALKFQAPGASPEVWIDGPVDGEHVHLTVRDNGIGFDPRYATRIFRVFERLHGRNEYPGTGIGLALCRKIAERHGGSIVADSVPGHGATFTVTLPLHAHDIAPAYRAPSQEAKPEPEPERSEARV